MTEKARESGDVQDGAGLDRYPIPCIEPDCRGHLKVSDAVYAKCDTCDVLVERNEVGI